VNPRSILGSIFAMVFPLAFAEKYGKAPLSGQTLAWVRPKKRSAAIFSAIS
jgi:hypothetical protein